MSEQPGATGYVPVALSAGLSIQAVIGAGLTVAHSLRARGPRRTALFLALGLGLPLLGEYGGVNWARALRHRTQPQVAGVPLPAFLGWYNIGYSTFAMLESLLAPAALAPGARRLVLPAATALTATSLDLLLDVFGLAQGLWEWHADGRYAAAVAGPNGRHGIPAGNFLGWLGLTGGVTALYLLLSGDRAADAARPGAAGSVAAGRGAALLLLPAYLTTLGWALTRGKLRYIVYAAGAPAVIALALRGRRP